MGFSPWTSALALSLGTGVVAVSLWWVVRRWNRQRRQRVQHVATVTGLYIYPIKSCRGISVSSAEVQKRGFRYDRRWLVLDTSEENGEGRFMTQRQLPKMALISVSLEPRGDGTCDLWLDAPGMDESVSVPVEQSTGQVREVRVWRMRGEARDCGEEVAMWLSGFLEKDGLRLVHMADDLRGRQLTEDDKWGSVAQAGDEAGAADFAPFLLANEKSLTELAGRIAQPITMERFRPNIVVKTASSPYSEESWRVLQISEIPFRMVKKCGRCSLTTVDPSTGEKSLDNEPLTTMRTYRMDTGDKRQTSPIFGVNLVADGLGEISIGDQVIAYC